VPVALRTRPFKWAFLASLGVGAGVAVLNAIASLASVLVYIGLAFFIALAFEPVIRWATSKGSPRWAAVLGIMTISIAAVISLFLVIVPALSSQILLLINSAPSIVDGFLTQPWVQGGVDWVGSSVDVEGLLDQAVAFISDPGNLSALGSGLLSIGSTVVNGVTAVILVTILSLYFTSTLPATLHKAYQAVPLSRRKRTAELADEVFLTVGRYVAGQLVLALINGLFVFTVLSLIGVSFPLFLALLAFVGALIPVVGTIAAYSIITLFTLMVSPTTALGVGLVLLVYAQIEAYVFTPRVMARAVAVPGALVIIAAIAGATLGGILGALVAVPVATAGVLIYERVLVPHQQRA
jgi:predicted PurR-regulated permease PerM